MGNDCSDASQRGFMKPQAVQILMPRGIIPGTRVVGALTSWTFGISIDIQADCAWHGWGRHTNEPLIGRRCPKLFIELRSHAKHGYGDREFDSRTASGSAVTRADGARGGSLQVKLHCEASLVAHGVSVRHPRSTPAYRKYICTVMLLHASFYLPPFSPGVSLLSRQVETVPECSFFLKSNGRDDKHLSTLYFCQHGNEPEPAYSLRHADPSNPAFKNRYAVALYDPYVPDILFGEVLIIPEWTQPTLSQEAIRQNGGIPPPPEPMLPTKFTIQLYNPDQQVVVRYKHKTWNSPASWDFEMPQRTFRQPSSSTLDRTQSDPAASDITPKLKFSWRKDGKLSKDLACYLSGTRGSADAWSCGHPRCFFGQLREAFNVSDPPNGVAAAGGRKPTPPQQSTAQAPAKNSNSPTSRPLPPRITIPQRETRPPPPADPRTQWEIDAENARLRQQQEAEARERKKRAEEEERKTKKLLEAEQKAARRKQAEVDKETERLKRIYGREEQQIRQQQASRPPMPPRPTILQQPHPNSYHHPRPHPHHHNAPVPQGPSPYLSVPGVYGRTQSTVQFLQPRPHSSTAMSGARPSGAAPPQLHQKRSSFFGLRKSSEDNKLSKKRSSMF
ncbi:hypothetical protein VTN00DRAFT_4852 [Thermoascus crustaceus]|uniref:uncharacterized protein n=1 Tax=Thermoascus crustaceus TaxID=5088 RepID=UPI003742D1E1